jgi:hypothetical protein
MSVELRRRKVEHFAHSYERVDRSIHDLDYFYYQCSKCHKVSYPMHELQKLWKYSETHQFMFIHDWALALLYSRDPLPIFGITSFVKQMFLVAMEFAQEYDIPTENPGFRAYNFGPYTERIEDVIIGLEDADLIRIHGRKSPNGEQFELSDKGREVAKVSFESLTPDQQMKLKEKRLSWHQWGVNGLQKYIYRKWPEYTDKSLVLDRVLHRRRLGRMKWDEGND